MMPSANTEPVTVVVTRRVKTGREAAYEAWLGRVLAEGKSLPGYLGTTVLVTVVIEVLLMTYLLMPRLRRWLSTSIHPRKEVT